jgi:glycosyltransferase involved in cell wall biosynthesis
VKKLNLAYITKEDSRNKKEWSGSSYNIYNCLLKTGHNVKRCGPYNTIFEKILKIIEFFFRLFKIKYDPDRSLLLSKYIAKKIEKDILNNNFDFIVVHDCPIISFVKTNIPIIIWTDLTFDLYEKTYFKNYNNFHKNSLKSGHYLEKLSLKKAKIILYTTQYAKLNAQKKYNIDKNKIKVLPFGSDISPITKKQFLSIFKKRIEEKTTKFISVGVDWERKNMSKSIEVINQLNKKGYASKLAIVGAKPPKNFNKPQFVEIIPFLSKTNNDEFNKLKKIYFNSDFFILLSKAEAFGLVLQEANSYALPVILNDVGGMKFVSDNKYSVLVNKKLSPNKIALKIINLIKDPKKYKKYSYNSYMSSFNKSWDFISKKIENIINKA